MAPDSPVLQKPIRILGIETSCDESSVAIVSGPSCQTSAPIVEHIETYSQIELHQPYGGIVPEIAARNHVDTLPLLLDRIPEHLKLSYDALAVTTSPGLMGALLVGVTYGKTISYLQKKPLIAVDHLEGHLASLSFCNELWSTPSGLASILPMAVLLLSGGHTHIFIAEEFPFKRTRLRLLSKSLDDAAGEVLDKTAKMLGLGYPGGHFLEQLAQPLTQASIKSRRYQFPQPETPAPFNMSFSGIKTSVARKLEEEGFKAHRFGPLAPEDSPSGEQLSEYCEAIQRAVFDCILTRLKRIRKIHPYRSVSIVGGVAANQFLRGQVEQAIQVPVFAPPLNYCTDNAAMIAASGFYQYLSKDILSFQETLELNASSSSSFLRLLESS